MSQPTNKQIGFAKKLGIQNPEQYSKEELSNLIDEAKAKMREKILHTMKETVETSSVSVKTSATSSSTSEETDIRFVLQQYLRSYSKMLILYDEVFLLSNMQSQTNSELSSELIVNRITDIFKQIEKEVSNMIEYKLKLLDYKFKFDTNSLLTFFDDEIQSRLFQSMDPKALSKTDENEENDVE